jgi:hypothetical protein
LCAFTENYKEYCSRLTLAVAAASPLAEDPAAFIDPVMEFRLYLCPLTGAIVETEIARAGDEPLHEIQLQPASIERLVLE